MLSRRSALSALALCLAPAVARAHPATQAHPQAAEVQKALVAFREALAAAVQAKDVARIKGMYTEDFTHTHGSGKVDGRDARIVSLLAGEPVIELAPMSEVSVRVHGADTAILSARSPILNRSENRTYDFRWIQVYVRSGGHWHLAASQATRLPPTA